MEVLSRNFAFFLFVKKKSNSPYFPSRKLEDRNDYGWTRAETVQVNKVLAVREEDPARLLSWISEMVSNHKSLIHTATPTSIM